VIDFDRRRSAWHESGHGLAEYLLTGKPPEILSLRPGMAYRAVAIYSDREGRQAQAEAFARDFNGNLPTILQPDGFRRYLETSIVISLAGDLAAAMAGYGLTGYVPDVEDDDQVVARTQAEALASLSPRRRELLAETEAEPSIPTDDESASGASHALTRYQEEVFWHVQWLRTVAGGLLFDHKDGLSRLAEALYLAGVMDAETFQPIADGGRCVCHKWRRPEEAPAVPAPDRSSKPATPAYVAADSEPDVGRPDRKEPNVTKPKAPQIAAYVARETAVMTLDGRDAVITAGVTRIRPGHPLLKTVPELFEPSTDRAAPLVQPRLLPVFQAPIDRFGPRIAQPIPPERRVRARHNLFVNGAWLAFGGSIWDSEHWVVKRFKDAFEPAPPEAA
jgi:hypothetical protein